VAQSSHQTVVKCQLENLQIRKRGGAFSVGGASTILEIVDNGAMVKKGDVLCRLDASDYEDVAHAQTVRVLQHQAESVQRDLGLQSALLALREYKDGLLPQEILGMQGRIALAESEVKAASDRLAWSERMLANGYAPLRQVAGDRQTLMGATHRLEQAQIALDVFRRFNAPKALVALEAEVEKARMWHIHEDGDFDKSKRLLANYRRLIDRCTIRAPHDGFVIYANATLLTEDQRPPIEQGASVYQGQELFYFPDLSRMEVMVMLGESVVGRIRDGIPARVRFEGSRDLACEGRVESVEDLPKRNRSDVPFYQCRVSLEVTPSGLLPGKSAEVEFQVGRCRDVLAIPSQGVSIDHGRHICYVVRRSGLERREITLGGTTADLVEVTDGLHEHEQIVLKPNRVVEQPAWHADPATRSEPETAPLAAIP
jgi:HlyD family secretion protein